MIGNIVKLTVIDELKSAYNQQKLALSYYTIDIVNFGRKNLLSKICLKQSDNVLNTFLELIIVTLRTTFTTLWKRSRPAFEIFSCLVEEGLFFAVFIRSVRVEAVTDSSLVATIIRLHCYHRNWKFGVVILIANYCTDL